MFTLCDARAPDHKRHIDVFLNVAGLAWGHAVLAKMVAVIGCVKYVRVREDVGMCLELGDESLDELINRLQRTKAIPVVIVDVVYFTIGKLRKAFKIVDVTAL